MTFIQKHSANTYFLHLDVKTNSKKQRLKENGDTLTIHLRSKPIKNKANKELVRLIKQKLNISSSQIRIVSGLKNVNKILEISFTEEIQEENIIHKLLMEK